MVQDDQEVILQALAESTFYTFDTSTFDTSNYSSYSGFASQFGRV